MSRAIGYVRVSTEEQALYGISLQAQTERIRAYCVMSGLELAGIISEEGVSASKTLAHRPGGQRLVSSVQKHGHIVALKLDRLFRDAADALTQTKEWDRLGIALHLIDMGGATVNTATAMGRFFLSMMAGFVELERNLIAERTATALQFKKSQGRIYGPTPYGFSRVGTERTRKGGIGTQLAGNDAEAAVLDQISTWRADHWTLTAIADMLTRTGVPTKRGGKKWYASTVRKILANRIHLPFSGSKVA
jgi:DNA invertase Pin-like site-specific DNA recombinase